MTSRTLTGITALALAAAALAQPALARDRIHIVGSSTVFPFATAVAERFGQTGTSGTPVVEATGSGGGLKLFCAGVGEQTPDIANASRRIKEGEVETCRNNGVTPVEVKIGFDGIVLASAKSGPELRISREQLFEALAKSLPDGAGGLRPNPNRNWSDIDPSLPNSKIEVLGPPPTSGTRDAFVELVMEEACPEEMDEKACTQFREDGAFIEAGENDNLIVQKLEANPDAYGIFGFSFLDQNFDRLKGAAIDGVEPTFEDIASGAYPVSRSLYFYIKKEHEGAIPGLKDYALEFVSPAAAGEEGYLSDKGLIPLEESERESQRAAVEAMKPVSM